MIFSSIFKEKAPTAVSLQLVFYTLLEERYIHVNSRFARFFLFTFESIRRQFHSRIVTTSMHVYMYAGMHVCMYACMHVCMYACMLVCMYACMHVCMCACMHVCMHACMHVCMYANMHVFMYAHMHLCI